jgi:hypothetical protein
VLLHIIKFILSAEDDNHHPNPEYPMYFMKDLAVEEMNYSAATEG